MDYNAYEILGLTSSATREQVDEKYQQLRNKYQRDRFLPGEEGERAAEKLQQIEIAYRDILISLEDNNQQQSEGSDSDYSAIQEQISNGNLDEAQALLDKKVSRDAEWHYLQAIVFYKRSWFLESKKQLEFACQLDPNNQRYADSLTKLTKILASNTISPDQMRTTSSPVDNGFGFGANNGTCTGTVCGDICAANLCCNCLTGCR